MEGNATDSPDVLPVDSEGKEKMSELEKRKKDARNARKNKTASMTRKMNKMTELMTDPANLEVVKENLEKYTEMEEEFKELHRQYECVQDTEQWFEPKRATIDDFKSKSVEWIQFCTVPPLPEGEDEIGPKDSISLVSRRSRTSMASTASASLIAQAEKAALLAKAASIKERHGLEEKEERLAKEREEIRRRKEKLDFEAELSAVNAKLAVLTGGEEQVASTSADGMEAYFEDRRLLSADMDTLQPVAHLPEERVVRPKDAAQHISVPLFQASRSHGGLQGDHTGHWLLPEAQEVAQGAQPTQSRPAERAARRGKAVSQPEVKPLEHSVRTELSTEYRELAPSNVIANSQAEMVGAMLSEQEQEQHRSLQEHVASNNLLAILNRQNEITSMLLKQQQLATLPPKVSPFLMVTSYSLDHLWLHLNTTSR